MLLANIATLAFCNLHLAASWLLQEETMTWDPISLWHKMGVLAKIVVVKRGPGSAICRSGDQQWSLVPPTVKIVDDVGAGDTFDAGFIHLYLRGAKLEDCLAFANVAAAYSVTREGGTEAFRDTNGLFSFIRQQWNLMGKGPLPGRG